jgi:hypothetical protein
MPEESITFNADYRFIQRTLVNNDFNFHDYALSEMSEVTVFKNNSVSSRHTGASAEVGKWLVSSRISERICTLGAGVQFHANAGNCFTKKFRQPEFVFLRAEGVYRTSSDMTF